MEKFVDFMSGTMGQLLRMVVGGLLILAAFIVINTVAQWILAILGAFFVLSGALKICLFNLFIGRPLNATPKKA